MVINIMTRNVWQAVDAKLETPSIGRATHVFWMNVKKTVCFTKIHCIELLKRAQYHNMNLQNQRDIRYNFMIGGDGNVYEGRGWGAVPLLPRQFSRKNRESLLIGFMGLFNSAKDIPDDMFLLAQDFVAHGIANDYIEKDFKLVDLINTFSLREPPGRYDVVGQPQDLQGAGGYNPNDYKGVGYQPTTYREIGYNPNTFKGDYRPNTYNEGNYQPRNFRAGGYHQHEVVSGSRWYETNLE